MNFKSGNTACLFDDYLFGDSSRNRSRPRSPIRNPTAQDTNLISFAQLSKVQSRPGSVKKGLFRVEIQKSKLKVEHNQKKTTNPYYQSIGSTQSALNKSPSKLLSLKNYGSLQRPESKHKVDFGTKNKQNHPAALFPKFSIAKNNEGLKSNSQQQKFRRSFTSLTKNQNQCSTTSATSNQSLKENKPEISNMQQLHKLSHNMLRQTKVSIQGSRQISTPSLVPVVQQNRQALKCLPTKASNFFDETDQVNISVSDSVALLDLDMNPYLI